MKGRLGQTSLEIAASVVVDKAKSTDKWVTSKKTPAPYGVDDNFQPRKRTHQGAVMRDLVLARIPEEVPEGWEGVSREVCRVRAANTVYVSASPTFTLGRLIKYLPKMGKGPAAPATRDEARVALRANGLGFKPGDDLTPRAVGSATHPVYVNKHSSNGLPVMGHFDNPVAIDLVMGISQSLEEEIRKVHAREGVDGVLQWVWDMAADPNTIQYVACLGRCKADYYALEKVYRTEMRFYNVFPRPLMLIMQRATQVLEVCARTAIEDVEVRTFSGLQLVRGGAEQVVEVLDNQLAERGYGFLHMGDDSWVVMLEHGAVVMFALDCSSFDLTQHSDVTREVHEVIREELEQVDAAAAALWFAYVRGRPVVTAGTCVRWWTHGGPSGCPLQAKVNGMLMDIYIRRVIKNLGEGSKSEARVASAVEWEGRRMGFTVKLEQYSRTEAPSLRVALRRRPFLFVGYWFYEEWDQVRVCCDLARQVAQVGFPGLKWIANTDLAELEAVRLASTVMSWGVPPGFLTDAFEAARAEAMRLLDRVGSSSVEHPRARWAVEHTVGLEAGATIQGLRRALMRPPEELWMGERELLSSSVWLGPEELIPARRAGRRVRVPNPRKRVEGSYDAEVHAPARRNDGRPPSTTVWAPDRAPRPLPVEVVYSRPRKGRKRTVQLEEWSSDSESDYYEDDE